MPAVMSHIILWWRRWWSLEAPSVQQRGSHMQISLSVFVSQQQQALVETAAAA